MILLFMEANELRIGNKVKCKISNDAGIYTVLALPGWENDADEFMVTIDRCPKQTVKLSQIKPIRITPEILKQYGFVTDDDKTIWHYHNRDLLPRGFRMITNKFLMENSPLKNPFLRVDGFVDIHFFHQMQNWFFMLSKGVELYIFTPKEKPITNELKFK